MHSKLKNDSLFSGTHSIYCWALVQLFVQGHGPDISSRFHFCRDRVEISGVYRRPHSLLEVEKSAEEKGRIRDGKPTPKQAKIAR